MAYPKTQYVIAVKPTKTSTKYFYGSKLGDLVKDHVPTGKSFTYAKQTTSKWTKAQRTGDNSYATV